MDRTAVPTVTKARVQMVEGKKNQGAVQDREGLGRWIMGKGVPHSMRT